MGNTVPRHSFKYKVDPDYSSAGSNESLPSPRCYRYNMTQGKSQGQHVTPSLMTEMSCDNLQHLCCSSDGTVWVCRRPQIIQLDGKGQTLLLLEVKIEICGLAASRQGELVFTDGKNKRLISTRFEDDVITKKVMSTNDWFPIGVCFAENGDIVVGLFLPSNRGRVHRYTEDGDTRYTLENDNNDCPMFCFPAFVTENGNGDVIVSDHLKRAVIAVDRWGRYRFSYIADKLNRPDAVPFLPFGVCCDSSLNIIVSDSCNDCLHLISVNGEFLYMLLTKSSGLYRPVALSMGRNGKLYVGDRNGIKIFHMDTHKVASSDGRKSTRANSLSSLEINRTSGNIENSQTRTGSNANSSITLKRSSTEKNISGNVLDFSKSYSGGSGGQKTNPMSSSFSFPNKSATLPLKTSLTTASSGLCSPLTSRRTNTLINASRGGPFSSSSSSSTSLASSSSSLSPASPKKSPLLSSTKSQMQTTPKTTNAPLKETSSKIQTNVTSSGKVSAQVTSQSVPSKTVTGNSSSMTSPKLPLNSSIKPPRTKMTNKSITTTPVSPKIISGNKDQASTTTSISKESLAVKSAPDGTNITTTTAIKKIAATNDDRNVKERNEEASGPKGIAKDARSLEQSQHKTGGEQKDPGGADSSIHSAGIPSNSITISAAKQLGKASPLKSTTIMTQGTAQTSTNKPTAKVIAKVIATTASSSAATTTTNKTIAATINKTATATTTFSSATPKTTSVTTTNKTTPATTTFSSATPKTTTFTKETAVTINKTTATTPSKSATSKTITTTNKTTATTTSSSATPKTTTTTTNKATAPSTSATPKTTTTTTNKATAPSTSATPKTTTTTNKTTVTTSAAAKTTTTTNKTISATMKTAASTTDDAKKRVVTVRTDDSNTPKSDASAGITFISSANKTASNNLSIPSNRIASNMSSTGEKKKQRDSNIIESTRI
uniref:Mucin-5AC-like n=1 Tax=Crassostrea virginica TaxID=6565 RepID=A0A8B8BYJ9_CRAVI|nr:mucin-5AC-like [Crassostrea virginica]XP_022308471.1 mucin-5AC-like [Crassostrea virginica]XP_022308472.1 mucin-5AC-like [Crassostrea virginica]XP_022308473.1 mucin-5AC-like [Crassostrea virginica]